MKSLPKWKISNNLSKTLALLSPPSTARELKSEPKVSREIDRHREIDIEDNRIAKQCVVWSSQDAGDTKHTFLERLEMRDFRLRING